MASFNRVILAGNLTRDPELRYTPRGTAVAKIGLAINRSFRTESGEQRDETTFVDVDAFGRQAEVICQYMRKGRPLLIEGRLRLDQWDDKTTGQKRSRLGVVLDSFSFLDSARPDAAGEPAPNRAAPTPPPARPPARTVEPPEEGAPPPDEDDVPF